MNDDLKYFIYIKLLMRFKFFFPAKILANFGGMELGEGTILATKNIGSEPFLVKIGRNCHITGGVKFVNHDGGVWVFRRKNKNFDVFGGIEIGDNTYVGNDVTILPGVKIGSNCVIGACSVITKSIPDNCVVAGNPGKFICHTSDYANKMIKLNAETKGVPLMKRKAEILKKSNLFSRKEELKVND